MGWDDLPERRVGIREMDAENPVYRDVKGEVTVPESFVLFCNAYGLRPEDVLHDYASDLAGQGNGSDERDLAEQHFRRSHGLVVGEYPEANPDDPYWQREADTRRSSFWISSNCEKCGIGQSWHHDGVCPKDRHQRRRSS